MKDELIKKFKNSEKEPLMMLIVKFNLSPIKLAIIFLLIFSIPLTIWGFISGNGIIDEAYLTFKNNSGISQFLSYKRNISWCISIFFPLPVIVGLSLHYYNQIPKLFSKIGSDVKNDKNFDQFISRYLKLSTNWIAPLIIFILNIGFNLYYYFQLLTKSPGLIWITNGTLFQNIAGTESGLSYLGLYSAIIQFTMIYWVINFFWRSLVFSWGLYMFFNKYKFKIKLDPLHFDGCSGLKEIGSVAMIFNWVLFLIGIYISLKVMDNLNVKNLPLNFDIGIPAFLILYGVFAPVLFFLPLASSHRIMKETKEAFLQQLMVAYKKQLKLVIEDSKFNELSDLHDFDSLYESLIKRISVWPFNFKSIESFFGTIIVPIFPILLPFLIKILFDLF